MSISKKILEHPVLMLCTFVLIAIVSAFTLENINIALMPDMDIPVAMVSTSYPNAGPETVEKSVTQVLESSLISVTNLKKMTSTSSEGMSSISLQFNYGTDMDVAVNELRDKIDKVKQALPTNASTPSIFQFDMSSMPIITLAVNGNRSEESLKKIADEQIADLLEQADGVAQASVRGGRSAIVRIELDQNRLEAYGLTLSSIARGLSSQNIEVGGGSVSKGTKKYTVRTTGEFESIDDINHSVVGTYNGYDVKLEDIGTASMGYSDVTSKIYINGKHGVYVSVQKQSGSNTVNVAKAVKEKIKEIEKTLPTDINIEIISDDSTSVSDTLTELIKSIVQGFILSVIVLFIFLRSGRSTFIMAISIPFCILITLTAMSFAGNLTTICVFIPFFVFKNKLEMLGQMFSSLMSVILIAILSSLFVAVFLVPVLAGKFLPVSNRKEHPIKNAFLAKCDKRIENALNWLTAQYQKGLHFVLRRRFATVVIAFGIFAASLVLIGRLNISFMSNYNDSSVSLNVTLPLGTKLEETQAILDDFYQFAQNEIKGYDNIVVSIGSGSGGGMSDTSYQGSLTVYLPDASKQIDNAQTVKEKLRAHFDSYPAATLSFNEGMMQQMSGNDINIVFRSSDLDASVALAKKIQALIKEQLPAVTEPQIDMQDGLPQVEIKVDRERAYSFGISIMSIANEINYEVQECVQGRTFLNDGILRRFLRS